MSAVSDRKEGTLGHLALATAAGLFSFAAILAVSAAWGRRGRTPTRRLRRPAAVLAVMVTTMAATAGVAYAWSSQNTGFTYRSNFECTNNHVYISDTTGKPHIDSWTQNWIYGNNTPCWTTEGLAGGLIRVAQDELWKSTSTGSWGICNAGAFYYNSSGSYSVSTGYNFNLNCGPGYYAADTEGEVYNGGPWYGGYLYTPYGEYMS